MQLKGFLKWSCTTGELDSVLALTSSVKEGIQIYSYSFVFTGQKKNDSDVVCGIKKESSPKCMLSCILL